MKASKRDVRDGDSLREPLIESDKELDNGGGGDQVNENASSNGFYGRPVQHMPPPPRKLKKLQSRLNLNELAQNELELKTTLFYHIGNPIKRWRVERVVPGKLVVQLLKTFCLIVQVYYSVFNYSLKLWSMRPPWATKADMAEAGFLSGLKVLGRKQNHD